VLLDDPLSALDAGTAELVFERLIRSPSSFWRDTAVVLVTHASHFLNRVDNILVIVEGENKFLGNWTDLASFEPIDSKTKGAIEFLKSAVQEEGVRVNDGEAAAEHLVDRDSDAGKVEKKGDLITIEQRDHGLSSLRTWLLWFKHAGGLFFFTSQMLFMALDRFTYVAVEYWYVYLQK
jgi:ABC-type multidrug transport system ATPase subunit